VVSGSVLLTTSVVLQAYSLIPTSPEDFAHDAIGELLSKSEECRADLVIILAGYEDEMMELLQKNQGLDSRFPIRINFPDYKPDELLEVAERMTAVRQFSLSADARELLRADLLSKPVEGNARHVRNLVEDAKRKHGTRVECQDLITREDLTTLTAADFSRI
jgi:stage V sporulation protein K